MGKAPAKKGRLTFGGGKVKNMPYLSREDAMAKLYVDENEFRKLVILKGIYPRVPKDPRKLNKRRKKRENPIDNKSMYYTTKDINWLRHEKIYQQMSEFKRFQKKIKLAAKKKNPGDVLDFYKSKPFVTFDHLIKERYPSFINALHDLEDCLTLMFLFSKLSPQPDIGEEEISNIKILCYEFMSYIDLHPEILKKTFLSVKGIYYQVVIMGVTISWCVPYDFPQQVPQDIDISIFKIYLAFYQTLMTFVNFKLYHDDNLVYPPKSKSTEDSFLIKTEYKNRGKGDEEKNLKQEERIKSLVFKEIIANEKKEEEEEMISDEDSDDLQEDDPSFFKGLVFFISRECPFNHCEFVIKSKGGIIETKDEMKETITHHILDRPRIPKRLEKLKREFIQPQWLFDCVNVGLAIPIEKYKSGEKLPPHLSPFVDYEKEPYVPEYAKELSRLRNKNLVGIREEEGTESEKKRRAVQEAGKERLKEEKNYQKELQAEIRGEKYNTNESSSSGDDKSADDDEGEEMPEDEERLLKESMMSRNNYRLYSRKRKSTMRKIQKVKDMKKKRKLNK